jgi:putative ABC transport system permease protein
MPGRSDTSGSKSGRPASLILHLLRRVTWPNWTEHRVRNALTIVGVALGVATVAGIADASKSVLLSFQHMVETVAGASQLEMTARGGTLSEGLVDTAVAAPGVQAAEGLVESFLPLADQPSRTLYLLGLDFLRSSIWEAQVPRSAIDMPDELTFVAQPDSVMVSRRFAERSGLRMGDPLRVVAPGGPRTLRIRGLLDDAPAAQLFDGSIAVMDLPAAQRLLQRDGSVDRIAIKLDPGVAVADARARLAALVGDAATVAPPEARGEHAERLLFSLRTMLASASALAVIVGAFIVFQTVAVSVQERRREFALLGSVGVGRGVLVRLCLVETAILGAVGCALGLLGGRLLAALAAGVVGDAASEIWLPVPTSHSAHSAAGTAVGIAIGFSTALSAAYLAVRSTFEVPAVEALRPARVESPEGLGNVRTPLVLGLSLILGTWLVALAPPNPGFAPMVALIIATQAVAYAGGALLGPTLVVLAGRAVRRLTRSSSWLPLRLAAENLPRSPRRTGTTVATITAALGMAVTLAGLVHSFERSWMSWLDHHFGGDLFVGSGARFRLLAGPPMGPDVATLLGKVPGVASVEPFRVVPLRLGERPAFLQGISVQDRLLRGGLPMVEGDLAAAAPALQDGTGVLVSDNLAFALSLHRGDDLHLPTPAGSRTFRVEGTYVDYLGSLDLGAVAIDRARLEDIWHDPFANLYRVWLVPGAELGSVRDQITASLGSGYYVISPREFLDGVRTVLGRFFLATWALQLVAALVGLIGVINSQLAIVVDRSDEVAMARIIGVPARDITRSVVLECAAVGLLGGCAGLALGAMLGWQFVDISLRLVTGWRIPFSLPANAAVLTLVIATIASAVAGYVPARAAAGIQAIQRSAD